MAQAQARRLASSGRGHLTRSPQVGVSPGGEASRSQGRAGAGPSVSLLAGAGAPPTGSSSHPSAFDRSLPLSRRSFWPLSGPGPPGRELGCQRPLHLSLPVPEPALTRGPPPPGAPVHAAATTAGRGVPPRDSASPSSPGPSTHRTESCPQDALSPHLTDCGAECGP